MHLMEGFCTVKLLYVDACPRGQGVSRTLRLADAFLDAFRGLNPNVQIIRYNLSAMKLFPVDGEMLAQRERLIDAGDWQDGRFAPARGFARAAAILVAAT